MQPAVCEIMEDLGIFKKLVTGAKFDFKRFKNEAERLKIIKPRKQRSRHAIKNSEEIDSSLTPAKKAKYSTDGEAAEAATAEEEEEGIELQILGQLTATDSPNYTGRRKPSEQELKEQRQKEVAQFRRQRNIHVAGLNVPEPMERFDDPRSESQLGPVLLRNVAESGYTDPTPIQMQAIPVMMQRRNVIACAPTGSGKTAAFLLPVLHHLGGHRKAGIRALILAPVRELAQQIRRECDRLGEGLGLRIGSSHTLTKPPAYANSCDVIVTTPKVLLYLLRQESGIKLSSVEWLIVDECDRMFDNGKGLSLREQLGQIYSECASPALRRALFSATYTQDVEMWCRRTFDELVQIYVGPKNTATDTVDQELIFTGNEEGKLLAVRDIIRKGVLPPVLIFVQTTTRAEELFHELVYDGVSVTTIHSERTQHQRDEAVKLFRSGEVWILISTQLMGRGMDFIGVNLVINYDFPQSPISYIHAVGRTGRAGRRGKAITFFTNNDIPYLRIVADVMKSAGCPVPDYITKLDQVSRQEKRKLRKGGMKRHTISTVPDHLRPDIEPDIAAERQKSFKSWKDGDRKQNRKKRCEGKGEKSSRKRRRDQKTGSQARAKSKSRKRSQAKKAVKD